MYLQLEVRQRRPCRPRIEVLRRQRQRRQIPRSSQQKKEPANCRGRREERGSRGRRRAWKRNCVSERSRRDSPISLSELATLLHRHNRLFQATMSWIVLKQPQVAKRAAHANTGVGRQKGAARSVIPYFCCPFARVPSVRCSAPSARAVTAYAAAWSHASMRIPCSGGAGRGTLGSGSGREWWRGWAEFVGRRAGNLQQKEFFFRRGRAASVVSVLIHRTWRP